MPKHEFDVAWRDQNKMASNAVLRRVSARDKADDEEATKREIVKARSSVPKVLPQDFQSYAITFFFKAYILRPVDPNLQQGFLDCLLPVWTQISPMSPLKPAVSAVAMSLLEAWSFSNPNSSHSLARSHYAQALVGIRRHLEENEIVDDEFLMAVLMLHMYDGILAFCGARPVERPHLIGSSALITKRQRWPCDNKISQRILLGMRGQVANKALIQKQPVSQEVLDSSSNKDKIVKTPEVELVDIECNATNLQSSASELSSGRTGAKSPALDILTAARDLDERLVGWAATMPDEWTPFQVWDFECIPWSVRDAGFYRAPCLIYISVFAANIFNIHHCLRIRIQLVMLTCLEHLKMQTNDSATQARAKIQDSADKICCSVPFHLGDRVKPHRFDDRNVQYPRLGSFPTPSEHYDAAAAYSGIFLTQRLAELLNPQLQLRAGQREWVLSQMQRIKRIYLATSKPGS